MQVTVTPGAQRTRAEAGSSTAAPTLRRTPPTSLVLPPAAATPVAKPATRSTIEVWVPDVHGGADLLAQKTGDPTSSDAIVAAAAANGQRVLDYVRREFGRDSFDGKGATLSLRVHAADPETGDEQMNNAYWLQREHRIWFGDGDGTTFAPLGNAADVMTHEFFHGVIDNELKQDYVGQEGAIHESFADVLATGIDGNWLIGEDVFTPHVAGDALRDIAKPQYTNWDQLPIYEDEVHTMSEVPSYAAYLVAQKLGAPELRQIWYHALTTNLGDHSGFADVRAATIKAAGELYGAASASVQAVTDAWDAVGILAATPKS
jgi:Zn-dependent metalloprotease